MPIQLSQDELERVSQKVEDVYELASAVHAPLCSKIGQMQIPPFPSIANVIASIQQQLEPAQFQYMMRPDLPLASFQIRLATHPRAETFSVQRALIDHQPNDAFDVNHRPGRLQIQGKLLNGFPNLSARPPQWQWEFFQAGRKPRQPGDETSKQIWQRKYEMKKSRPDGVGGSDIFSWTTAMAYSIKNGRPLDSDGTMTILEDEGLIGHNSYYYAGRYAERLDDSVGPILTFCACDIDLQTAVFRSSLRGPITQNFA